MLARLHRYLLIALLLLVPVQGMAAAVHALACGPADSAAMAEHGGHDHGAAPHDHGAAHQHDQHSGSGAGDHAQHQCCHQVTAAPAFFVSPAPADLPVYLSFALLPELTFVLEQPQRPPRS